MISRVFLRSGLLHPARASLTQQCQSVVLGPVHLNSNYFYSSANRSQNKSHNITKNPKPNKIQSGEKKPKNSNKKSEENKEARDSGKEKKQIQAMPNSLTKLITSNKKGGWPSLTNIAILTSKCNQAGVDMDQVEAFFIGHFRSKSNPTEQGKKSRQRDFFSKHLLEKHLIDDDVLNEYLESYLEPNIYQKSDKMNLPIKRAEYCMAIMRLAFILGDMPSRAQENIKIVESFIQNKNISDDCLKSVLKLAIAKANDYKVTGEDRTVLLDFVCDKRIIVSRPESGSINMPSLLILSDSLQMMDSLCETPDLSPYDKTRILTRYSQICWDQANFSLALETLQTLTESYLASLLAGESEDQARLLELSLDVVEVWHNLGTTAAAEDLRPAVEFLVLAAEMMSKKWPHSGLGLLPSYILLLSVSNAKTEAANFVREKLQHKIVSRLRSEKFERCFIVAGMTQETKLFFTRDFLHRLLLDNSHSFTQHSDVPTQQQLNTREVEEESHKIEDIPRTESAATNLAVDMLDITVLELASEKKNAEMVDTIIVQHSQSGLLPSSQAMATVIKTLQDSEDLYSLTSLKRLLPPERPERESCYEAIASIKLRELNSKWEEDKIRAWVGLVQLYRKIWSDQNSEDIQLKTGQSALKRCRNYAKLFIEEAVISSVSSQLMKPMQLGCTKVATDFGDLALLALYWEALFFSSDIEHHQLADLILDNVPVLVDQINIDLVLQRCQRSDQNYRRLVEMCLRRDCSAYVQSRVFEEMLLHQVERGNLRGAGETLSCAKSLDIKVTADFVQQYLNAKQEAVKESGNSYMLKLKQLWKGK